MQLVPWRRIADWRCIACGDCCKLYSVVLNFSEWLKIVKTFGVEQTISSIDKLYIKRRDDGSCAFLCSYSNAYLCGLQYMKPSACQLWPFKVLAEPRPGTRKEAEFNYAGNKLFVYADCTCRGLTYGIPSWEFTNQTLKEFVEIALGIRREQYKTTGNFFLGQRIQPRRFSTY